MVDKALDNRQHTTMLRDERQTGRSSLVSQHAAWEELPGHGAGGGTTQRFESECQKGQREREPQADSPESNAPSHDAEIMT